MSDEERKTLGERMVTLETQYATMELRLGTVEALLKAIPGQVETSVRHGLEHIERVVTTQLTLDHKEFLESNRRHIDFGFIGMSVFILALFVGSWLTR